MLKIKKEFTKIERYTSFLLTALAELSNCSLFPEANEYSLPFHSVLRETLEYVKRREHAITPGGNFTREDLLLEFGVYKGTSINIIAEYFPERKIFGFDSFEGFPDDGRQDWQIDFSVPGPPAVPKNVSLIKGFFADTLPAFLAQMEKNKALFLNIDCDLYSSTKDIFQNLIKTGKIVPGTVIYLDELINSTHYLWNEFFALFEMLEATGLGVRWLYVHRNVGVLEEELLHLKNDTFPDWKTNTERGFLVPASLEVTELGVNYGPLDNKLFANKVKTLGKEMEIVFKKHGVYTCDMGE